MCDIIKLYNEANSNFSNFENRFNFVSVREYVLQYNVETNSIK